MTVLLILSLFVFVPAIAGLISSYTFTKPEFRIGAPLVYRQEEASTHPTSDARDVRPAARGEFYYYSVISYLRVAGVLNDGRIVAIARNNERVCVWPSDSGLRRARLSERLLCWPRFPRLQSCYEG